ncbi:organic solute transporter Ostalpha-domain-containing protein [Xylariales sp. PMI_506]|nr:organic solute transporter Ostalpha-domain-containing protein [Xylariales sp. PMI_506]
MNLTCNSTLEDMRITSEIKIAGPFTFHQLALIIAGGCSAIAILTSFYLMFRHATNYTKPTEQKHIIRILFMVPIYASSSFLSLWYYWHAVYFEVISDCYEAFAISSFFALMCHYIGPDLHEQKEYFRHMDPVKPWVMPINWMAKCCGGDRGPWRTPKSGLTWFNIIWIGIYHYCFIRVTMTITAVVTQYFDKYCESSNSPVFAHIWVLVIESVAVTIAMYCVVQFYIQLKEALSDHKPFLKVLSIKLVIFLSFWQSSAISVGTSTLHLVSASATLAYPDLKVGIPALLLCVEMSAFAILHLWAFPYQPYVPGAKQTYYPGVDSGMGQPPRPNEHTSPQGGFLGVKAFIDAINLWDVVKAFGRGMRWLFVGVRKRHLDPSYNKGDQNSLDTSYPMKPYGALNPGGKSTDHLPIASEFRRSTFYPKVSPLTGRADESAGLIDNAQGFSNGSPEQRKVGPYLEPVREDGPVSPYQDSQRSEYYESDSGPSAGQTGPAYRPYQPYSQDGDAGRSAYMNPSGGVRQNPRNSTQLKVGNALWGNRPDYNNNNNSRSNTRDKAGQPQQYPGQAF